MLPSLFSTFLQLLLWTSPIFAHLQPEPKALPDDSPADTLQKRGEKKGDHKYFHEPGGDDILGHYDTRYFHGVVSYEERTDTLTHMIRAYLNTFRELGLETWIAHGTLLGWWWNGKVWDSFPLIISMLIIVRSYHGTGTSIPKSLATPSPT
jgi:hypothetical protein